LSGASGIISAITGNLQTYSEFANSSSNVDVIGVFDQNFNQLFSDARPLTCKVKTSAKFMEQPLENGATFSDHRVIMPIEIEMNLVFTSATYYDNYQAMLTAYNGNTAMIVQTRVGRFKNMFIQDMPHDETGEVFDTITMILKLREVQIVTTQSVAVANVTNSPTVKTGSQNGTTQTAPAGDPNAKGSVGYSVTKYLFPKF
jgi:hypothetical protein